MFGSVLNPYQSLGATFILDTQRMSISGGVVTSAQSGDGNGKTLTSSAGKEFTLTTSGPFPTLPSLRTNNTDGRLFSSTGGVTGNQSWHAVFIVNCPNHAVGAAAEDSFFVLGNPAAAQNLSFGVHVSNGYSLFDDTGSVAQLWFVNGTYQFGYSAIIEAVYDGAVLKLYFNGMDTGISQNIVLNISDASFGFGNWYTYLGGQYVVTDARIDSAMFKAGGTFTRAQIQTFLRNEIKRLGDTGKIVAFFGDSTTSGGAVGTTPTKYLPYCVRTKQSGHVQIYQQNRGVSGKRSDELLPSVTGLVDPCTHAHIWWGVNDLGQGVSAATVYANTITAVNALHAKGIKVVVSTVQQWAAIAALPLLDAQRVAYNNLVLANSAKADAVVDLAGLIDPYNASNFCSDTLHPNDTCNDTVFAPAIYAALAAL